MEQTLTIHKVIHGGKGLGILKDGMVVMVPGVLPGEIVTVRETKSHRGHKEADLIRIEHAAPDRVAPPCPYYGRCGGCNLQHATKHAQLEIKRQILAESLIRARLELADDQPGPTLASPRDFGYRHRIRLHLDAAGNLGFHQTTSNTVVPVRRCLLATDAINRVLQALVDDHWPRRMLGLIGEVELLHSPIDDRIILVLHPLADAPAARTASLTEALQPLTTAVLLRDPRTDSAGKDQVKLGQRFDCLGRTYRLRWDPACFFQVNVAQNPQLIELALGALAPWPSTFSALDLFCGMGNFSIPLALQGAQVTGIEHNRNSIRWATSNAAEAALTSTRFIAGNVEAQLRQLVRQHATFDSILLDPPRQGLGKAASLLPKLRPWRIVSISCDPATQARDMARIMADGYSLLDITPVDMFPQTHHIESVALLERN
jgi:23S rRNA (uracil1939-C5)-methyltransferase